MNIKKCQGEGQASCTRCNEKGIWNRNWMSFMYEIEGMSGIYCKDCVEEIKKELKE